LEILFDFSWFVAQLTGVCHQMGLVTNPENYHQFCLYMLTRSDERNLLGLHEVFLSFISSLLTPSFICALIKFQVSPLEADHCFSSQGESHVRRLQEIIACDE